jgi:hypothetical protein
MKINHRFLATLLSFVLTAGPLAAADVVAPASAGAGRVIGVAPISFGPQFSTQVQSLLQGLSMASHEKLLGGIQDLRLSYEKQGVADQRFLLAALSSDPAGLAQRLAQTDLPKAEIERIEKISEHVAEAVKKDAAFAKEVAAVQAAVAATPKVSKGKSDAVMASAHAAVEAFLGNAHAPADSQDPAAPDATVVQAGAAHSAPAVVGEMPDGQGWSDADLLNPAKRPQLKYGTESLPLIALPSEGTNISDLWTKAHSQANAALIVAYNFDDMNMAQSIVQKAKAGEKIVFVGDYSNWFPERMPQAKKDAVTPGPTAAMKYILDNMPAMGQNFELYILKGLGDIGINHNKFTLFNGPNGKLLQGGSFNYSMNSQTKHWEIVVFTNDAERIDAFTRYFAWLTRRARKYSPDLEPQDPTFDPADPIPTVPPSEDLKLHGVPFPKVVFSPNGQGEATLVKAINLVKQKLGILMFSPFPTPLMVSAIEAQLAKKVAADMIADASQAEMATPIVGLIDHGMPIKDIHGPDMELHKAPYSHGSFEHEKDMLFDADMIDGLVKMADSLNISGNAFNHNFENIQLWNGFYAKFLAAHYRFMWNLAHDLPPELIQKLREKIASEKNGEVAKAPPATEEPVKGRKPVHSPSAKG